MNETNIAHYRILRKLGEGGMEEVWLVQDTRLQRQVALKLLPAGRAEDRKWRQRFLTEARAASALNHPNVCVIYEVGETEDQRPQPVLWRELWRCCQQGRQPCSQADPARGSFHSARVRTDHLQMFGEEPGPPLSESSGSAHRPSGAFPAIGE